MPPATLHHGEYVLSQATLSAFAEAFVALTSADDKKAQVTAAVARKALGSLSGQYEDQVAKYWDDASKESLRLLTLVMQNNPKKSKNEILKRPDVQDVLREPYRQAAAKSETALLQAWDAAEQLSSKHAKAEFKMLGEPWQGHALNTGLRDALVADLHANADAMRGRLADALSDRQTASQRLLSVANDGSRRARYSIQHAVWAVATQVRESSIAAAGLNKVWIAVLDDRTCSHCKALHGTVIGPGEQFSATAGSVPLKVYQTLYGPPRHPNCRCVIVATKLQKSK